MDFNLILIAVNFPSASLVDFESFFDCIEEYHSLESKDGRLNVFLIVGDFNLPGYKWFHKQTYSSAIGSHDDHIVNECIDLANKFCIVYKCFQHDHLLTLRVIYWI